MGFRMSRCACIMNCEAEGGGIRFMHSRWKCRRTVAMFDGCIWESAIEACIGDPNFQKIH